MSKDHNRQELRFLFLSAIFIAVVLWFLPTTDFELTDTECATVQQLGRDKYLNDFKFDGSWDFNNPACNAPETIMLHALYFLDQTPFILPTSEEDFDFYKWARNINPTLRKRDLISFSGTSNFKENRIDLAAFELERADPVSITNILVHELRHLEEGKNTHVPCTRQRKATCDERLEENPFDGGAYNYNVAYLHRLIEYGAVKRSQKRIALKLLENILENKINKLSKEARQKY